MMSTMMQKNTSVILLKCPRQYCGHIWEYKGASRVWATCSFCGGRVHVVRDRQTTAHVQPEVVAPVEHATVQSQHPEVEQNDEL